MIMMSITTSIWRLKGTEGKIIHSLIVSSQPYFPIVLPIKFILLLSACDFP